MLIARLVPARYVGLFAEFAAKKFVDLLIAFRQIRKDQTGKSHPSNLAAPLTLRPWWRGSSVALRRRLSPGLPFNFLSIGSGLNRRVKHSRGGVATPYVGEAWV